MKALAAALLCLLAAPAAAAPPEGADMRLAPWFRSLQQPKTGMSCCSIADCRPTDFRASGDHYEAFVNGEWTRVAEDKVVHQTENPTGRAVVCWTPVHGIMCFVPGPET
jgi:hypothetical protein